MLPARLLLYSVRNGRLAPHWFSAADYPWLRALLDEYERFAGTRRRELVERLREPLPCATPQGKLRVATLILDRLYGSERADKGLARRARSTVFQEAARRWGSETRALVLERAARTLDTDVATVEASLFSDLPGERRVGEPTEPVEPADLALRANLALAQGLVFRAAHVRIELEGNARAVVRHAKLRGLIGVVLPRARQQDAALELSGPLALFRRTLLYGRALSELIPILCWCDRFSLKADVNVAGNSLLFELCSGDPILPAVEPRRFDSKVEDRFARDFKKIATDWEVVREPEPVAADGTLIFPDFALQHRHDPARRWLLEIVGFWTQEYLEEKLRRLKAAALSRFIVLIDAERNVGESDLPPNYTLLRYRRRIDPADVLRVIDGGAAGERERLASGMGDNGTRTTKWARGKGSALPDMCEDRERDRAKPQTTKAAGGFQRPSTN